MREYFERCAPGQAGVDAGRLLELCRELQRTEPYRLGDDTPHVALVSQDFQGLKAKHQAMGLIFDELANGIYFIQDPDGHILEILPPD